MLTARQVRHVSNSTLSQRRVPRIRACLATCTRAGARRLRRKLRMDSRHSPGHSFSERPGFPVQETPCHASDLAADLTALCAAPKFATTGNPTTYGAASLGTSASYALSGGAANRGTVGTVEGTAFPAPACEGARSGFVDALSAHAAVSGRMFRHGNRVGQHARPSVNCDARTRTAIVQTVMGLGGCYAMVGDNTGTASIDDSSNLIPGGARRAAGDFVDAARERTALHRQRDRASASRAGTPAASTAFDDSSTLTPQAAGGGA